MGLLVHQDLLHLGHLEPDPDPEDDGDDEDCAEHEVLADVGLLLLDEEHAEVDEEDLFGEGEQGGDEEVPELDVAGGEDGGGEVRGDGGEADDKYDPEAAVAREAGEGAVVEVGALESGGFAS